MLTIFEVNFVEGWPRGVFQKVTTACQRSFMQLLRNGTAGEIVATQWHSLSALLHATAMAARGAAGHHGPALDAGRHRPARSLLEPEQLQATFTSPQVRSSLQARI